MASLAFGMLMFGAARQVNAAFYPGNDRASLAAEAAFARTSDAVQGSNVYIVDGMGNWRYIESDFSAYLTLARSPLAPFMTIKNRTYQGWPDQQILQLVENAGPGFGGQCLSFVSLLLLRSSCTDSSHLLMGYAQLTAAADKNLLGIHDADWGDIVFRPTDDQYGRQHTAVIVMRDSRGVWVGDSNYLGPRNSEMIGIHLMTWDQFRGYRVASLPTLLRDVLHSR
jgi:hypothetical protein